MIALILRHRFILAPVLLSSVTKSFAGLEHRLAFYRLARQYLPEELDKLMGMNPTAAAGQFVKLFSARYFPISAPYSYGASPLQQLVTPNIAVTWHGLGRYDYDSRWGMRLGHMVAAVVCAVPPDIGPGARIAVLDIYKEKAGETGKLPRDGHDILNIEQVLEGDDAYPGLLDWCRWLFHRTGNRWLDSTDERPQWEQKTVESLDRDWAAYGEIKKRMDSFDSWLGHNFAARSAGVIAYIDRKMKSMPKRLVEILGVNDDEKG